MAFKRKSSTIPKPTLKLEDNPSLVSVGGEIHLRVLEDFYIEKELPKWKHLDAEWEKICKAADIRMMKLKNASDVVGIAEKIKAARDKVTELIDGEPDRQLPPDVMAYYDKSDEELARIEAEFKARGAQLADDRYDIQGRHEREVKSAIDKNVTVGVSEAEDDLSFVGKMKRLFGRKHVKVPVEVAMRDIKDHIMLTSTDQLAASKAYLDAMENAARSAGQIVKADKLRSFKSIVVEETVVAKAGFASFLTEEQVLDFIKQSEKGVRCEFLRYYEGIMPPEVVTKKLEADRLMVFDNYAVLYYSDVVRKRVAATVASRKAGKKDPIDPEKVKQARESRRDPILLGLIKNSRKLYYICDWIIPEVDDLTLEKLEAELGTARYSLVKNATVEEPTQTRDETWIYRQSAMNDDSTGGVRMSRSGNRYDVTYGDSNDRYINF